MQRKNNVGCTESAHHTFNMSKEAPKDASKGKVPAKVPPTPPPRPLTPLETLHSHIVLLEKFVDTRDTRFLARVLRYMSYLRAVLPSDQFKTAIQTYVLDASRSAAITDLLASVTSKRTTVATTSKVCLQYLSFGSSPSIRTLVF